MRLVFLLLLSFHVASTSSHAGSHSAYSLSYEAVVGTHVIDVVTKIEDDNKIVSKGYATFTALATEIAGDIVQLFSDTKKNAAQQDRNVEMDQRCYETLMGGGRCNIDHVREGEVTIQIVVSYDISPDQSAMVRVEATVAAMVARTLLIQSIPMINKQLDCYQGMLWSISKRRVPAERPQLDHGLSLETMVLERHDLEERTRIVSLGTSHPIEIWQYTEGHVKVRTLFVDGYLQSTTHVSGAAHAEALVHPAVLSVVGVPEYVVIMSLEPTAILKEVLKHARVQSILLVGADTDALALAEKYMPSNNNCSFIGKAVTACLSQPNVRIVNESVAEWLTIQAVSKDLVADVVLVDVPPNDDELLSLEMQTKLRAILSNESVVVVASGSTPKLGDAYDLDARHSLLQQAPRATAVGGLNYFHIYVYDEPLASPLASSFIAMFTDDSEVLGKFIRTNAPAIENDIVEHFHHTKDGPLTIVYDGATHVSYQRPSKAWQYWRCNTPPGNHLYECTTFLKDWYNRDNHYYKTEVRKDAVKGRSLISLEAIPKGGFVLPDDGASSMRIDNDQWIALNEFVERFPDADLYRQIRDFFVAYGFMSEPLGQSGWCVSIANNSTFTNHACTEAEANVKYVDDLYISEDGGDIGFSPFQVRFAELVGVLTRATRDIAAGEELQMDYYTFRSYPESDSFHKDLLGQICNSGVGMVAPDDGDLLVGLGDPTVMSKND